MSHEPGHVMNSTTIGSSIQDSPGNFSQQDATTIANSTQGQLAVANGNVVTQSVQNLPSTTNTESITIPGTSTTNYGGKKMNLNTKQKEWRQGEIDKLGSVQAYRNKYRIGEATTTTTPPTVKKEVKTIPGGTKVNNNQIVQEFDARSNKGRKQQLQGISSGQNKMKRLDMSDARAEWKGMTREEKQNAGGRSSFMKGKRTESRLKTNAVKRTQFAEVNRQREMQNKQGLFAGGGRKIQQNYTPVDFSDSRLYDTPGANSKGFTFKSNLNTNFKLPEVNLIKGLSGVKGIGSGSASNSIFGRKPGGTKVGNALKNTFGRKSGGSKVGNALRSVGSIFKK